MPKKKPKIFIYSSCCAISMVYETLEHSLRILMTSVKDLVEGTK